MSYFRPKPASLHHSDGRPCPACAWCDEWDRSKRIARCVWVATLFMLGFGLAAELLR